MEGGLTRAATLRVVRAVLAANCACSEAALMADGVLVTPAEERVGRRRFPQPALPLLVVTMGAGVVVSCHPSRLVWLRTAVGDRDRDAIFAAPLIAELATAVARDRQELREPDLKLLCSPDTFRRAPEPSGVTISVVEGSDVAELYRYAGFSHALAYRPDHLRPDVAAVVAQRSGEIIGVAGASADCAALWQVGVDVIPTARGSGIGRVLVARLTETVFHADRVPYYSAAIGNLRSIALATSLGYWPAWPAWSELYVRDLSSAIQR
jgi:GNAT superfamily N-acetyltransferase